MTPITSQPYATVAPIVASCDSSSEKGCAHQQYRQVASETGRCRCARSRSPARRIVSAVLLAAFAALMLMLFSCLWDVVYNEGSWLTSLGFGEGGSWASVGDFVKRQSDGSGNGNTFVDRKYYLIIVFIGLVLVILGAICLSAWCCRGVFENPLCCPCYVCAWCGGLACLECIGCGLCAEGIDQM